MTTTLPETDHEFEVPFPDIRDAARRFVTGCEAGDSGRVWTLAECREHDTALDNLVGTVESLITQPSRLRRLFGRS